MPVTAYPALNPPAATAFGVTSDQPTQPDPVDVAPRAGKAPLGASGRAHWSGYLQPDEQNPELVGVRGLYTFDDMYFVNPYVRRMILMLASTIQGGTLGMESFGGDTASDQDKQIRDKVWWWLTKYLNPNIHEHLGEALPVVFRNGFTPFEQLWNVSRDNPYGETLTLPHKLAFRLPRTIFQWPQDEMENLAGVVQTLPTAAQAFIPASELVYYRVQAEGDNWAGRSLLRQAFMPHYYYMRLLSIEAIGLERKATGLPVVYRPVNATRDTLDRMEAALAACHTGDASYLIAPGPYSGHGKEGFDNGWFVDVIKFDSSAGGEIEAALNRHQDAIAASILGDFMSLGHHQVGAKATAQVQEDPFLTVITSLIAGILSPLNRLIQRVVKANWPSAKGAPELQCSVSDTASLSEIATFVQSLVASGAMQVDPETEDWLRERAQMPAANGLLRKFGMDAQVARLKAQTASSNAQASDPNGLQKAAALAGGQDSSDGSPGGNLPKAGGSDPKPKAGAKNLDDAQVDPKWFEKLLEKHKLAEAIAGAKQRVKDATGPAVATAISKASVAAANQQPVTADPPPDLVDAFEEAFHALYRVGYETAAIELYRQHSHLGHGRQLMAPATTEPGSRFGRVRARAIIAARGVQQALSNSTARAQAGGVSGLASIQATLQRAATGALAVEANASTMDLINAGRFDVADSQAAQIAQATYTACLDGNTCDQCAVSDGTVFTDILEAEQSVPNALCAGGAERCRCTIVFQLDEDPRAYVGFG